MEKENIMTVDIEDFKKSQHILDYIDDDFAIVNSLDGIPYSNDTVRPVLPSKGELSKSHAFLPSS